MKKIVTFGEVMMRLKPPGYAKFSQSDQLELTFGGGEANTAVSLAYFGMQAMHVTMFPDNLIGRSATQFLRRHWVNTSQVQYGGDEMGIYFLESGAVHRSSTVVYDRSHSAFANMLPDTFDWKEILKGADWFHWTGITPAISENTAATCLAAIKAANKLGVMVSADVTYRQKLWNYGKSPQEILPALVAGSDVIIAGSSDLRLLLETEESLKFSELAQKAMKTFPNIKKVADKDRESLNASHNTIRGKIWNGKEMLKTQVFDVTHIIDRVGTGDAYAAGLIYGLLHYPTDQEA
nr:sugar kinase [Flammeovirgaceae bacterium]